jgi:hypothetical protein
MLLSNAKAKDRFLLFFTNKGKVIPGLENQDSIFC